MTEAPAPPSPSGNFPSEIPERLPHLHNSLRVTHDQLVECCLRNIAHEKSEETPAILLALERKR
jgi:hypothetical protein